MKIYLCMLLLLTSGCASTPLNNNSIVHEYVIDWAQQLCIRHNSSLHYIIPMSQVVVKGLWGPECDDVYRIRCQNNSLIEFTTFVNRCGGIGNI